MICSVCETENQPGDRFCEQCGAALRDVVAQKGATTSEAAIPSDASVLVSTKPGSKPIVLASRVVVGRLDSCDLPIHDKSVSREHARLSELQAGYVVEDLGSTNGTLLNGRRIDEATLLHPGDVVTFGSVEFRFETGAADDADSPARSAVMEPSPNGAAHEEEDQDVEPVIVAAGTVVAHSSSANPSAAEAVHANGNHESSSSGSASEGSPDDIPAAPDTASRSSTYFPEVPSSRRPLASSETEGNLAEAIEMANRLTDLVLDLGRRLQEGERENQRARDEAGALQNELTKAQDSASAIMEAKRAQEHLRGLIEQAPRPALTVQRLQDVQELVNSLVSTPRDIDVLRNVAQHAPDIAAIVEERRQLRNVLDSVALAIAGMSS